MCGSNTLLPVILPTLRSSLFCLYKITVVFNFQCLRFVPNVLLYTFNTVFYPCGTCIDLGVLALFTTVDNPKAAYRKQNAKIKST